MGSSVAILRWVCPECILAPTTPRSQTGRPLPGQLDDIASFHQPSYDVCFVTPRPATSDVVHRCLLLSVNEMLQLVLDSL